MTDENQIIEMLHTRDVEAFARGDWEAVADDFDASFTGYSGSAANGLWTLAFPDLASYRDVWLAESARLTGEPGFAEQLAAAQRIASVEVADGKSLVRKEFDGRVTAPSGPVDLSWTTYYFLRHGDGRWRITGFVGFLPPAPEAAA